MPRDSAYMTVSDGVGVGLVLDGQVVRGHGFAAGEFGHVPLSLDGPRCLCGARGCLEAYTSNLATASRYLGHEYRMATQLYCDGVSSWPPRTGYRVFKAYTQYERNVNGSWQRVNASDILEPLLQLLHLEQLGRVVGRVAHGVSSARLWPFRG